MQPLGLHGLKLALRTANGPAQHLLMGVWGIITTAGFWAVNVPIPFLAVWVLCSLAVIYCTIWSERPRLLFALKADTMLTVTVLSLYLWEEYTTGITTPVFFAGRLAAASVLVAHGFYLIDLVHRQILDAAAFKRAQDKVV
jgi:hypothetical protein